MAKQKNKAAQATQKPVQTGSAGELHQKSRLRIIWNEWKEPA